MVTGGGAFNKTLIDYLKSHSDTEIIIPEDALVKYKESVIFGLMGILRVRNEENIKGEGTGASKNSIAGGLHGDFSKLIK